MTKDAPVFGIDVAGYQAGIDMGQARREGMRYAFVKATEGPYLDGTPFTNHAYRDQIEKAEKNFDVVGIYHFLVETPVARQVDHYLRVCGDDLDGKIAVVDFEAYNAPHAYLTPGNETLEEFIAILRQKAGPREVLVYSGRGFWTGGDASGPLRNFGADLSVWDAYYRDMLPSGKPQPYYQKIKGMGWGIRWGDVEPIIWQFTAAGRVAGFNMDVNACRISLEELASLKGGPVSPKPKPVPERPSPGGAEPGYVKRALDYLERTVGGDYVPWWSGPFTSRAPAWVGPSNGRPPSPDHVRREGAFCAALVTLPLRLVGKPLPVPHDPEWEGGILDYGRDYVHDLKIAERYQKGTKLNPADILLWEYTGAAIDSQGHVAVMGRDGKMIQADIPGGINRLRTPAETIRLFAHGKTTWVVRRKKWLKP